MCWVQNKAHQCNDNKRDVKKMQGVKKPGLLLAAQVSNMNENGVYHDTGQNRHEKSCGHCLWKYFSIVEIENYFGFNAKRLW